MKADAAACGTSMICFSTLKKTICPRRERSCARRTAMADMYKNTATADRRSGMTNAAAPIASEGARARRGSAL